MDDHIKDRDAVFAIMQLDDEDKEVCHKDLCTEHNGVYILDEILDDYININEEEEAA